MDALPNYALRSGSGGGGAVVYGVVYPRKAA